MSEPLLDEIGRVLSYAKIRGRLRWGGDEIARFLLLLRFKADIVDIGSEKGSVPRDPGDDPVLASRDQVLLSGPFRGTIIHHCVHTGGNNMPRSAGVTFVGVREFKEKLTGYLGKGEEMVVTRHGKPIARVVPVGKGSPEDLLLGIGMVLKDAGVTREQALTALKAAGKLVYG
jgi:prevent-host-death family protein